MNTSEHLRLPGWERQNETHDLPSDIISAEPGIEPTTFTFPVNAEPLEPAWWNQSLNIPFSTSFRKILFFLAKWKNCDLFKIVQHFLKEKNKKQHK